MASCRIRSTIYTTFEYKDSQIRHSILNEMFLLSSLQFFMHFRKIYTLMQIIQSNSITQDWIDFNFWHFCVGNIHFVDEECLADRSVTLIHYSEVDLSWTIPRMMSAHWLIKFRLFNTLSSFSTSLRVLMSFLAIWDTNSTDFLFKSPCSSNNRLHSLVSRLFRSCSS